MERYLVELTGHQLDRLNGMVREAINAAQEKTNVNSKTFFRLCMISAGRPEIVGATDARSGAPPGAAAWRCAAKAGVASAAP